MKMRKWYKNRVQILYTVLLIGGIIIYKGYANAIFASAPQNESGTINHTAQKLLPQTNDLRDNGVSERVQKTIEKPRQVSDTIELGEKPLSIKDFPSPVKGEILRDLGSYYSDGLESYLYHAGVDYAEPEGTVIRATHGGKVVFAGKDPILGQKVTLDCGEGWLVTYGGLDNLRVHEGETIVNQGALGQVGFLPGADGQNNRTQMHYEVWHTNVVQRPL